VRLTISSAPAPRPLPHYYQTVATWEDGPEYAPLERPQYFADAPLPPLDQAPPVARPADGQPTARPHFDHPSAPVAPLASLVPEPPDERDPNRPFDVVTATLTSESGWGTSPTEQPFVATAPFPSTPGVGLLGPSALPGPTAPPGSLAQPGSIAQPGRLAPQSDPYAYPSPGTPGWFAPPPPAYGDQRQPGRVDAKQVVEAATPGLCICLALGGLILPLSPVLVIVALFLSTRVRVAQRAVQTAFRLAAGAVGLFAVVGLFRTVFDGDPWWSFVSGWSAGICWVLLGVLLLVVRQTLVRPTPPQPPTPNPWG
jgi:hypothetical protein